MSFAGHHHSEEWKARMRASKIGVHRSPEMRAKLSASKKGTHPKGHPQSAETREKLRTIARERVGCLSPRWKGGRRKDVDGYVLVKSPHHPYAHLNGEMFEHRIIMEAYLGRPLLPTEVVHHINGIKDDNRIENLMLFDSNASHKKEHAKRKTP